MSFFMEQPVTTGCLTLLLILFSMNYTMKDTSNKLGLVTVNTLVADTQIWNLFTCHFYESKLIKLAFDMVGIIVITRSLKLRLGKQTLLYLTASILSCSLLTSAYCFIRYFSTGLEEMIMAPIFGFSGVFMIILTYARQQLRSQLVIQAIPNITYNNLPILVVIAQMLLWLIGLKVFAVDLPFSIIGLLFSWSYLRFYYYNDEKFDDSGQSLGKSIGDSSEEFAFIAMFPKVNIIIIFILPVFMNGHIKFLTQILMNIAIKYMCCIL